MIQWAPSGATKLDDDNKIVCYWRRPDDGLMKYKALATASATKWAGKSHPAVNANKQNSGGVDYHDQFGVLTAQIS